MRTKVYRLFGSFSAGSNAMAAVQIARPGVITGWSGSMSGNNGVSAASVCELSMVPTMQPSNDISGLLDWWGYNGVANAQNFVDRSNVNGVAIDVSTGDRLYLNSAGNGGNNTNVSVQVYVAEK